MKYETARSIRFNVKIFVISLIVSFSAGTAIAWQYIKRSADPEVWPSFELWIQSLVKCQFLPSVLTDYKVAATYLREVKLAPTYYNQFGQWAEIIFIKAPVWSVCAAIGAWFLYIAIAWRIKRNKRAR